MQVLEHDMEQEPEHGKVQVLEHGMEREQERGMELVLGHDMERGHDEAFCGSMPYLGRFLLHT